MGFWRSEPAPAVGETDLAVFEPLRQTRDQLLTAAPDHRIALESLAGSRTQHSEIT
jgi:hypothetical protein